MAVFGKSDLKGRSAVFIETANLAIKDRILYPQLPANRCTQIRKVFEPVVVPRNQMAFSVLDISQCAETVEFNFKQPVGTIKWLQAAR